MATLQELRSLKNTIPGIQITETFESRGGRPIIRIHFRKPSFLNPERQLVDTKTFTYSPGEYERALKHIKFLKMDCEGAEFDIFENSKLINKTPLENVGIEIHLFMEELGKNRSDLVNHINKICINPPMIKYNGL